MAESRTDIASANRDPSRVSLGRVGATLAVTTALGAPELHAHYLKHIGEVAADLPGWTDIIQESAFHTTVGAWIGVGTAYLASKANRLRRSIEGTTLAVGSATVINVAILEWARHGNLLLDWKEDTAAAAVGALVGKVLVERPSNVPLVPTSMPPLPAEIPLIDSAMIEVGHETI